MPASACRCTAARPDRQCRAAIRRRRHPPPRGDPPAARRSPVERGGRGAAAGREAEAQHGPSARIEIEAGERGAFRALAQRADRVVPALDHVVVDAILEVARHVRCRAAGAGWSRSRRTGTPPAAAAGSAAAAPRDGPPRRHRRRWRAATAVARPRSRTRYCVTQSCGRTCSAAASGPRFSTVTRIRMSSGAALAYSTVTSK